MPDKLKPCPFCSGEASDYTETDSGVICKTCGATSIFDARHWNARPIEDALRAELEELEKSFGAYVYHTTDRELSKPYDVAMLNAMYDDAVAVFIEEETAKLRAENATSLPTAAGWLDGRQEPAGKTHY